MNRRACRKKEKTGCNKGFSLIEVLVAMTVLSVGLLAMAGLSSSVMQANRFSKQQTDATTLAREKMGEKYRLTYDQLPDQQTTIDEDYGDIDDYPLFRRVTVVSGPGVPQAGMKTITVSVLWDPDSELRHRVDLQTIVTE